MKYLSLEINRAARISRADTNKIKVGKNKLFLEMSKFSIEIRSNPFKATNTQSKEKINMKNPNVNRILFFFTDLKKKSKPMAAKTAKEKSAIKTSLVGWDVDKKGIDNLYGILAIGVGKAKRSDKIKVKQKNNDFLSRLKIPA